MFKKSVAFCNGNSSLNLFGKSIEICLDIASVIINSEIFVPCRLKIIGNNNLRKVLVLNLVHVYLSKTPRSFGCECVGIRPHGEPGRLFL